MYREWEKLDQSKTIDEIRSERYRIMMDKAQATYEESLEVIREYSGPGGGGRYLNREVAAAARKRYLKAYGSINNRKPEQIARNRDKENRNRINPRPRSGAPEFYRHLMTAPEAECFYCHKSLSPMERYGDHYIPLAKGGPHCESNLVIACYPCNSAKSDQMPEDFKPTVVRVNPVVTMRGEQGRLFA